MPEWAKELSTSAMIIVGIVTVALAWIKYKASNSDRPETCSTPCSQTMLPMMQEISKVNTELVVLLREMRQDFRDDASKQREVSQGLIIAVQQLISLTQETLNRVKDLQ